MATEHSRRVLCATADCGTSIPAGFCYCREHADSEAGAWREIDRLRKALIEVHRATRVIVLNREDDIARFNRICEIVDSALHGDVLTVNDGD